MSDKGSLDFWAVLIHGNVFPLGGFRDKEENPLTLWHKRLVPVCVLVEEPKTQVQ